MAGKRGVGDENVHVAGFADQPCHLGALGEVDRQRTAAELGSERVEHVRAPTRQDQLRAAPREGACDRLADTPGGAGQQNCRARDLHQL